MAGFLAAFLDWGWAWFLIGAAGFTAVAVISDEAAQP